MRPEAVKPGDVLAHKYRVRGILGRSRGLLVDALHTDFDQRVCVRILSPALCDNKQIERFRREVRILAKLQSEHVARILDVGTLPDGAFYFARQFLEGTTLRQHLAKTRSLPVQQAIVFLLEAAEAVAETHAHNILLRELQPDHLFLAQRLGGTPVLKIIDFGTAKLMREAAAPTAGDELTSTTMFGMSAYSSPELIRKAKNVDVRTDVWSLGAILYEMLAGRPAFTGEMAQLMLQISREEPPPLAQLRRDLPKDLDKVIRWCLAKDVDGRFANVHALATALAPYAPPEAQALAQRIGELARVRNERRELSERRRLIIDPNEPVSIDDDDVDFLEDEDGGDEDESDLAKTRMVDMPTREAPDITKTIPRGRPAQPVNQPAANLPPRPAGQSAAETFERTVFMGADYVPPSPAAPLPPGQTRQPPAPPAPAAYPGAAPTRPFPQQQPFTSSQPPAPPPPTQTPLPTFGPSPNAQAQASAPTFGSPPNLLGPSLDLSQPRQRQQSHPSLAARDITPPGSAAALSGLHDTQPPKPGLQKGGLIAIGASVLGLTLLAGFLVLKFVVTPTETGPATSDSTQVAATAEPTAEATGQPTAEATAEPTPNVEATASPSATESATPAPTQPAVAANDPRQTPTAPVKPTTTSPAATPTPTSTPTPKPTAAPTAPSSGGGMGTLVAVAVGGSCAFSVNGASKGSGQSIKLQVKPGSYTVSCKPTSGGTKTKTVTVEESKPGMAMFKLQ